MSVLSVIAFFLFTVTSPVLSSPSKYLAISEQHSSKDNSRVVSCEADFGTDEMYWTGPDGRKVDYMPTKNIYSVKRGNKLSLIVQDLNKIQEGRYACHKFHENGKHHQEMYYLGTAAGPPEFEIRFEEIAIPEGSDVEIPCHAEGDPKPTYTWYSHVGKEILETEGRMFLKNVKDSSILFIKNITFDLKGMYACNAQNSHGMVTKTFRLSVVDSNTEVVIVEKVVVLEVTENSVDFFLKITNSTSDEFQIFALYNETCSNETTVVFEPGDRLKVNNLTASGDYDFRFRVGKYGKWSEKHRVVLLPAVPNVIVFAFFGGSLQLYFFESFGDFQRRTIDKYRLTYTKLQVDRGSILVPDKCNISIEIPRCIGKTYILAGLGDISYYEIQVEAHTSAGYGKPFKQRIFSSYKNNCYMF